MPRCAWRSPPSVVSSLSSPRADDGHPTKAPACRDWVFDDLEDVAVEVLGDDEESTIVDRGACSLLHDPASAATTLSKAPEERTNDRLDKRQHRRDDR